MTWAVIDGKQRRLVDDEITWAGDCPWTGGYCFGTENGEVLFAQDEDRAPAVDFSVSFADEAINGVAFFQDFMGVSSRSETNLVRKNQTGALERVGTGPDGAHGILATPKGRFIAPMGPGGILCVEPSETGQHIAWIDKANGAKHNYYSLRYLARLEEQEVLVCAARTDGLLTIRLDSDQERNQIIGLTSPGLDFIDVCALQAPECPYAVAALCHDRSLIFVRNVIAEETPQTVRFEQFRGVPYSILSAQGHLFVLTSQEIVILPNLGSRFANGEALDRPIHLRRKAMQAVDAFVSRGHRLLIITDDGVDAFEISKLAIGHSGTDQTREGTDAPLWAEDHEAPALITTEWHSLVP